MASKHVYFFGGGKAEGNGAMKDVLGGKGAGLAEMTNLGVPVPPGFTVSTAACNLYYKNRGKLPQEVKAEIASNLAKLERTIGKKLGDPKNPLLVSVRSGAKFSMPGIENFAPERTDTSSGFFGSPSFLPIVLSSLARFAAISVFTSWGSLPRFL